jgi:N-acetylglucosamine kinase-like BadF-type ATPase
MAEGWGEGNGSSGLVTAAVHEMALAHHGQIDPTELTSAFQDLGGFHSALEMFEAMARGGWAPDTSHARLVLQLALAGDEAAVRATTSVAQQHARDVIGVARTLDMLSDDAEVVLAGSVHASANPVWSAAFRSIIEADFPTAILTTLTVPPVIGSVLLAADELGIEDPDLSRNLREGSRAYMSRGGAALTPVG